jgi:PAS domain-containing protein
MPTGSLKPVIACLRDATPGYAMWSEVLPLITSAYGGVGAACFACNDQTGGIAWASIFGPMSAHKANYLDFYAALDLHVPILAAPMRSGWLALSECVPERARQHSEWYQDFVRPTGISDVQGIQLHREGPHRFFFGIQYQTVQAGSSVEDARLQRLLQHLQQAARRDHVQRTLGLRTALGNWVLDHLGEAVFVVYDNGRIIEMNASAEGLLARSHALAVRHGELVAIDATEARQLAALIVRAGEADAPNARLLVGRADHRQRHLVTVFPLQGKLAPEERATVAIRVVDLLGHRSASGGLADLLGFTPAEDRLVQALLQGKSLLDMTTAFGVRMPTLRALCGPFCASAVFSARWILSASCWAPAERRF